MCKFCENKKPVDILKYDNLGSMSVSYGQYKGVSVFGELIMNGNMLALSGHGGYRSASDCYYEDWGLDCDGERAYMSSPSYINIKYCPFCGRELDKGVYEVQVAKDRINVLEEEIDHLERDLEYEICMVYFTWEPKDGNYEEYRHESTLSEIVERFTNVKAKVKFGVPNDDRGYYGVIEKYPVLDESTKIHCGSYWRPTYYSSQYNINKTFFNKLVEYGLVDPSKKENGFAKLKKNVDGIKGKINKKKTEIKELKETIKWEKIR